MAYGESDTPRFCVSPSISQCVLALSKSTQLYLYEVDVSDPEEPDGTVLDATQTGERWITQAVVDRHGGEIRLRNRGPIMITRDDLTNLKVALHETRYRDGIPHEDKLWRIDKHGVLRLAAMGSTEIKDIISGGKPYGEQVRPKRQTEFVSE